MIRREQVHPNEQGEVTLEALIEAAIRGCSFLDFAGGTISIVVERQPTGFPGEMFTTKAAMEWRHDARVEPKPQQFEQATVNPEAKAQFMAEMDKIDESLAREPADAMLDDEVTPLPADVDPADGFDYSKLDEEDVEAPVAAS